MLRSGELYDFLSTGRTLVGTGWNGYDIAL